MPTEDTRFPAATATGHGAPGSPPPSRPPGRRRFLTLFAVALLSAAAGWGGGALWRRASAARDAAPRSAGKREASPDGRFEAEGLVCSDGRRVWCTMAVVARSDGRRVFYLEQPIGPGDRSPMFDQGNASNDGIEWDGDSSAVLFEGKNGQAFVVPVR